MSLQHSMTHNLRFNCQDALLIRKFMDNELISGTCSRCPSIIIIKIIAIVEPPWLDIGPAPKTYISGLPPWPMLEDLSEKNLVAPNFWNKKAYTIYTLLCQFVEWICDELEHWKDGLLHRNNFVRLNAPQLKSRQTCRAWPPNRDIQCQPMDLVCGGIDQTNDSFISIKSQWHHPSSSCTERTCACRPVIAHTVKVIPIIIKNFWAYAEMNITEKVSDNIIR